MCAKHEGLLFHIIWNTVYLQIMLFSYEANLLHNKMRIITSEIMKYDWDLKSQCL